MASNQELIDKIGAKAEQLGVQAPSTDGLNNQQLVEALKDLKAPDQKPDGSADPKSDDNPEKKPDDQPAEKPVPEHKRPKGDYVAMGRSICCRRGILGEGARVEDGDVPDAKTRERLLDRGILVRVS